MTITRHDPSSILSHINSDKSFYVDNARTTLHVRVLRGRDRHHIVEAAIKALGIALRDALTETGTVFSTKGSVHTDITES